MKLKNETILGMRVGKLNSGLQRIAVFMANTHIIWIVVLVLLAGYLFGFLASCFVGLSILLSFLTGYGLRLRREPGKAKMITALHHAKESKKWLSEHL